MNIAACTMARVREGGVSSVMFVMRKRKDRRKKKRKINRSKYYIHTQIYICVCVRACIVYNVSSICIVCQVKKGYRDSWLSKSPL